MNLSPEAFDALLITDPNLANDIRDCAIAARKRELDHLMCGEDPASSAEWAHVEAVATEIGDSIHEADLDYFRETGETDAPFEWVREHRPALANLLAAKRLLTEKAIVAERGRT